jgi:hypothetical protein
LKKSFSLNRTDNLKKGSRPERPEYGAGNGVRTRDTKLGKLVLYQLSYARPLPSPCTPHEHGSMIGRRYSESYYRVYPDASQAQISSTTYESE